MPLIQAIARQIHRREILTQFIPPSGREDIPAADVLYLLTVNLTLAKDPLYQLSQWVDSLDLHALGYRYDWVRTYTLHYENNEPSLQAEARKDGVYPLLCTDPSMGPKEVLEAYKFQPRLEKRFCQLKSVHQAAPLLFKKLRRVEANLLVFFMALLIQALLERLIRQRIAQRKSAPLKLYPEDRDAPHPTTSQVLKTFDGLHSYMLTEYGHSTEPFRDQLNDTHRAVLALLDMSEHEFWNPIF